jgi:RNA polymerase sigma-70 factor (ECF subfamily)
MAAPTAFAALYERYEQRVYNLAYRITGSEADAADATEEAFLRAMRRLPEPQDDEEAFALHLFAAARSTCHDLVEKREPGQATGALRDPPQGEVGEANMRLPERQREALSMLELGELSYEEIAASMETSARSVAELISRARLNLSGDLHGRAVAAATAPSPECGRATPLIAAREDGQLEVGSEDATWLDTHLAGCERCRLCVEAMGEAGASYRAWAPVAALPWLFEETMAKAAASTGLARSEEIGVEDESWSSRRRGATAAAALVALLLGIAFATVLLAGEPSSLPDRAAADKHPASTRPSGEKKSRGSGGTAETTEAQQATAEPSPAPSMEVAAETPSQPSPSPASRGASALQPQRATGAPESEPTHSPPSQPTPVPTATATTQPPAPPASEELAPEHPSKGRGPPDGVPRGGR